jgi:hypothetical protein
VDSRSIHTISIPKGPSRCTHHRKAEYRRTRDNHQLRLSEAISNHSTAFLGKVLFNGHPALQITNMEKTSKTLTD